jgi:hypothetical protein
VADAALYAAKARGRNTFTVHPTAVALVTASAMEREKAA